MHAPSWGRIGLFEAHDAQDVAALVVLRGHEVVIAVVTAILHFIGGLLPMPTLQRLSQCVIVDERAAAGLGLDLTHILKAVFPAHRETLDLRVDADGVVLHVHVIPRQAERLSGARGEIQAEQYRHMIRRAEWVQGEYLPELVILETATRLAAAQWGKFLARHFDEAGGVLVYLFDRGLVSVNKNDCNLPIFNLLLLADDERVAIVDGGLHALAGHTQGEILTAARLLL